MSWVGVSAVNNYIDGSMRAVGHTLHLLFASCHRSCPVLSCPVLPCPALSCPVLSWSTVQYGCQRRNVQDEASGDRS
jgi:hypothetical protein